MLPQCRGLNFYKYKRGAIAHFRSCISDSESGPAWYKYFLCGVKGALEVIPAESVPTGILVAVWGNIPPNSGLSSSSALVSAALLSIVHASQVSSLIIHLARNKFNIIMLLALYYTITSRAYHLKKK